MQHFSSLADFHAYMGWPEPEYPMFSLIPMDSPHRASSPPISTDLYIISLKHVRTGELLYGRTRFDFSQGCMSFNAPRQVIEWSQMQVEEEGFLICIHEDYLRHHPLAEQTAQYGFFSYAVHEALHLSPREEAQMMTLYQNLQNEYGREMDEHSREIVLSLVDTLFKYATRFYQRQFIGRAEMKVGLAEQVHRYLAKAFAEQRFKTEGLPSIDTIAQQLGVSPRYLTDALKSETGKSAKEQIHLFLLDKAKDLLLEPNITVAQVAYQLGFEYPQYFSRLFKSKTGVSPSQFQKQSLQ
ncbi:AraC family transcriptional regulator, transcriptional activator of pobA [uncultured Thiomicrorhabdus sp.]|jgi:AraC-like DNA-binding protein